MCGGHAGSSSRVATRRCPACSPSRATARTKRRHGARSISRSRSIVPWSPRSPPTSTSATTSRCASPVPNRRGRFLVRLRAHCRNGARALAGAAVLTVCAALAATPARAQALTATEAGVGAMLVLAHRSFWGPELVVARRPGTQGRFALTLAAGDDEGALGIRVAADAQLLLRPGARGRPGPYAGVGLAFVGAGGTRGAG